MTVAMLINLMTWKRISIELQDQLS